MKFGSLTMAALIMVGCGNLIPTAGKSPDHQGTNPENGQGQPTATTLVPDAEGPAPVLATDFSVDSFETLLNHVAPGFSSERIDYAALAEKWKNVLTHEAIDLTYLHFPYQGELTLAKATTPGQSCANTFFLEADQIENRHFVNAVTMSEAVKSQVQKKSSLASLPDVKVLDNPPAFAAVSYDHKRSYNKVQDGKTFTAKTIDYTSHVGVAGSRFLEAYELIETEYKDQGESLHLKTTIRCVRIIEPENRFERTSCSEINEWGPRPLFNTQLIRFASLLELSAKDGAHSVKDFRGSFSSDVGISKSAIEATQTGDATVRFHHDYSKRRQDGLGGADGLVNPHYKTAEGDLTFSFGKNDNVAKRDVSDCQVNTLTMQQ